MPMTELAKNAALDALPDTIYVALFEGGAPGDTGSEVAPATLWGSGARPAVTLDAASGGVRSSDGDDELGTVDVASQAVTHVAYYDADAAGNLLGYGVYARTLVNGDVVTLPDAATVFGINDPS